MKAVLIGLIALMALAVYPLHAQADEVDPTPLSTESQSKGELKLSLAAGALGTPLLDLKVRTTPTDSRYGENIKLVGALSVALYWVSGEEGLREAFLARRAGKVLLGFRWVY